MSAENILDSVYVGFSWVSNPYGDRGDIVPNNLETKKKKKKRNVTVPRLAPCSTQSPSLR